MQKDIKRIADRALSGAGLEAADIKTLLALPAISEEAYYLQYAARYLNQSGPGALAEVHGQVGVVSGPCPCDCQFCSFARSNGVFKQEQVEAIEDIRYRCQELELAGANAIYLMVTASYRMDDFIKIAREIRGHLHKETIMVANVGDFDYLTALALKDAGFDGIYHALRLGEGKVTKIKPVRRIETMQAAQRAGLRLGTCVEPVGPEHSLDELVEKIQITRQYGAVFSGAARRITIPGTSISQYGMVSEAKMALIVAVVNLATGHAIAGNCTHEPAVSGAMAGANLLWAEAGANPRDTVEVTETSRGFHVKRCREILSEAEVEVLQGPSRWFSAQ